MKLFTLSGSSCTYVPTGISNDAHARLGANRSRLSELNQLSLSVFFKLTKLTTKTFKKTDSVQLTIQLEALDCDLAYDLTRDRLGGGGQIRPHPLRFFLNKFCGVTDINAKLGIPCRTSI